MISQKLGSRKFWKIANSALNKGKSAIPPLLLLYSSSITPILLIDLRYTNGPEVLSSASDKA